MLLKSENSLNLNIHNLILNFITNKYHYELHKFLLAHRRRHHHHNVSSKFISPPPPSQFPNHQQSFSKIITSPPKLHLHHQNFTTRTSPPSELHHHKIVTTISASPLPSELPHHHKTSPPKLPHHSLKAASSQLHLLGVARRIFNALGNTGQHRANFIREIRNLPATRIFHEVAISPGA